MMRLEIKDLRRRGRGGALQGEAGVFRNGAGGPQPSGRATRLRGTSIRVPGRKGYNVNWRGFGRAVCVLAPGSNRSCAYALQAGSVLHDGHTNRSTESCGTSAKYGTLYLNLHARIPSPASVAQSSPTPQAANAGSIVPAPYTVIVTVPTAESVPSLTV